jgi:drug/metabolite transporter (DMT)-like permease
MKIRLYQKLDKGRWIGFIIAIIAAYILSDADVTTQALGWGLACVSCSMWVYFAVKDKDIPRAMMELMYMLLAMRAVYNWVLG